MVQYMYKDSYEYTVFLLADLTKWPLYKRLSVPKCVLIYLSACDFIMSSATDR